MATRKGRQTLAIFDHTAVGCFVKFTVRQSTGQKDGDVLIGWECASPGEVDGLAALLKDNIDCVAENAKADLARLSKRPFD